MNLFKRFQKEQPEEPKEPGVDVSFRFGSFCAYRDVTGFFVYNGEVFHRAMKGSGKRITDGKSFSDLYMSETVASGRKLGDIIVQMLTVRNTEVRTKAEE